MRDFTINMICGFTFCLALALAGSEGPYMPAPNLAGLVLLYGLAAYVNRHPLRPAPRR